MRYPVRDMSNTPCSNKGIDQHLSHAQQLSWADKVAQVTLLCIAMLRLPLRKVRKQTVQAFAEQVILDHLHT